jgi:RNA polymerase sigma factor (sigma-70 family)
MIGELDNLNFLEAFDDCNKIIYKYIYLRVGRVKEVAEDLTQETFFKAFRKFKDFDKKDASIKTWLFVIARNTVIDFYRKNKINVLNIENVEEPATKESDDSLLDFVLNKLHFMKDLEKDVIIYKYVYDLPDKEIAKIINKSDASTRVLIHRSLNKLKLLVNERN